MSWTARTHSQSKPVFKPVRWAAMTVGFGLKLQRIRCLFCTGDNGALAANCSCSSGCMIYRFLHCGSCCFWVLDLVAASETMIQKIVPWVAGRCNQVCLPPCEWFGAGQTLGFKRCQLRIRSFWLASCKTSHAGETFGCGFTSWHVYEFHRGWLEYLQI